MLNENAKKPYIQYVVKGETFTQPLKRGSNTIGSSSKADIVLINPWILPIHAQIIYWPKNIGNHCTIIGGSQRDRIFLNSIPHYRDERRPNEPYFLENGDVISFGDYSGFYEIKFIVKVEEEVSQLETSPDPHFLAREESLFAKRFNDVPLENLKEIEKDIKQSIRRNIDSETLSAKQSEYEVELNISSKDSDSVFKLNIPISKLIYFIHKSPIFDHTNDKGINIDSRIYEVTVNGELVDPPLTKLEFNVLSYMYSRKGEVCTKDDFADNISGWNDRKINKSNEDPVGDPEIYQVISRIRRKIGSDYIKTISGRGYRLIDEHN